MPRKPTLKRASLYGIIGIAISTFVLTAILFVVFVQQFASYSIDQVNTMAIDLITPQVQHYFQHPKDIATRIRDRYNQAIMEGEATELAAINLEDSSQYIRRIERVDQFQRIQDVYPMSSEMVGMDVSGRSYQNSLVLNGVQWSSTFIDPVTREATMAIRTTTADGGEIVIYPDLSILQGFLENVKLTENSMIGIVNPQGVYVAHNIQSYKDERVADPLYRTYMDDMSVELEDVELLGKRYIPQISSIQYGGWALLIYQSYDDLVRSWLQFAVWFFAAFLAIIVIISTLAIWVYRNVVKDIQSLELGVKQMANHEYDLPAYPHTYAEIGETIEILRETGQVIRSREEEITSLNIGLEKRVVERTQDLEAMNEELIASITELQDTQERLLEARKMVDMGRLVAGVAHEMNTPIGNALTISSHLKKSVETNSQALLSGNLSKTKAEQWFADLQESLDIQQKSITRSAELVSEFKLMDTNQTMRYRWVDFKSVTEGLISELKKDISQNMGQVVVEYDGDLVYTDATVLKDVLRRLLSNVFEHAYGKEDQKPVQIIGKKRAEVYEITVTDQGKGMNEHQCQVMFRAFEKGQQRSGQYGLGLFIVGSYVRNLLDGEVACVSTLGQGTTIKIELSQPQSVDRRKTKV